MKSKIVLFAAILIAASFLAPTAEAVVLRVVTVQTDNPEAYVKEIEAGRTILKKLGSTVVIRVWQARYAGDEVGTVVVTLEFADMITFATESKKSSADPEYAAWLKGLNKVRKVVSDSLYEELK